MLVAVKEAMPGSITSRISEHVPNVLTAIDQAIQTIAVNITAKKMNPKCKVDLEGIKKKVSELSTNAQAQKVFNEITKNSIVHKIEGVQVGSLCSGGILQELKRLYTNVSEGDYSPNLLVIEETLGLLKEIEVALISADSPIYKNLLAQQPLTSREKIEALPDYQNFLTVIKELSQKIADREITAYVSFDQESANIGDLICDHLTLAGITVERAGQGVLLSGDASMSSELPAFVDKWIVVGTKSYRMHSSEENHFLREEAFRIRDQFAIDTTTVVSMVWEGSVKLSLPGQLNVRQITSADCRTTESYFYYFISLLERLHDHYLQANSDAWNQLKEQREQFPKPREVWASASLGQISPLQAAIRTSKGKLPDSIVKADTVNKPDSIGSTPLHDAAQYGRVKATKLLLERGGNLHLQATIGGKKWTPPQLAARYGKCKTLSKMIESDPTILEQQSESEGSLLHIAVGANQLNVVAMLLKIGNVGLTNSRNRLGRTPLAEAASLGQDDVVSFLYRQKSVNKTTKDGEDCTPLHLAILGEHSSTVRLLASYGASITQLPAKFRDIVSRSMQDNIAQIQLEQSVSANSPLDFNLDHPRNLVFKGGGPKFHLHVGALIELDSRKLLDRLVRVAGTSAGSVIATLVALGYKPEEIESLTKNEGSFANSLSNAWVRAFGLRSPTHILKAMLKPWKAIPIHGGLDSGEGIRKFIEERVHMVTNIANCTFDDFHRFVESDTKGRYKDLFVVVQQLNKPRALTFISHDHPLFRRVPIAEAVRASCSIPAIFEPWTPMIKDSDDVVRPKSDLGSFCDGGVIQNLGLETFDWARFSNLSSTEIEGKQRVFNRETLGLCIEDPPKEEGKPHPTTSIFNLPGRLLKVYKGSEVIMREIDPQNAERAIVLSNLGTSVTDANLSEDRRMALITEGRDAVQKFLTKGD